MPWTTDEQVDKHNKGLSAKKKKAWKEIANADLAKHGDEARAIKIANAAVAKIKESMTLEEFELFLSEAAKIMPMDQSHDAIRGKIQDALTTQYRLDNPNAPDYYNTPYVRDVFGDGKTGQVVHSKGGKHTMSDYKADGDGKYSLKNHKAVKTAYVADNDADDKSKGKTLKESISYDGQPVLLEYESLAAKEVEEVAVFQEAAIDAKGNAKIKLISPGTGSMGHYPETVLKQAASDKIFPKGTRMFLDHQSASERAARPEGDVKKWVATTTSDAVYMEKGSDGPGLYADTNIYADHRQFIKERAKDIGVSIRAGVVPSGKIVDGVPEVKEMKFGLSADFVTRAGRGGKLIEMYESFRSSQAGDQGADMTEEEKKTLQELKEANVKLTSRLDRVEEENQSLQASKLVQEALSDTGLSPRAQKRITSTVLASLPVKDGKVDMTKLQESIKAAVTDEMAYLQEAGVTVSPKLVRFAGGTKEEDKTKVPENILAEAEKKTTAGIDSILGRK